ncbi:MAG: hypothetical protein FWD86_02810 [Firmicutes bacterium]|nr:hypothetical protein [Bacillota bacterium]
MITLNKESKIILSRKGVDSSSGGFASPVIIGKKMMSIPIPIPKGAKTLHDTGYNVKYKDIVFKDFSDKNYEDIINDLGQMNKLSEKYCDNGRCHLDPDIVQVDSKAKGWKPSFGQDDSANAQTYLANQREKAGLKSGDLFLFFGWFREAEEKDGKLSYKKLKQDDDYYFKGDGFHAIWGYLQIGEIIIGNKAGIKIDQEKIDKYCWHPHANVNWKNNTLYIPTEKLSINGDETALPGYGVFDFAEELILSEKKQNKSVWTNGFDHNKGHRQEKVIDCIDKNLDWVKKIFKL